MFVFTLKRVADWIYDSKYHQVRICHTLIKVWIKLPSVGTPLAVGKVIRARRTDTDLFWDIGVSLFSHNPFTRKIFLIHPSGQKGEGLE